MAAGELRDHFLRPGPDKLAAHGAERALRPDHLSQVLQALFVGAPVLHQRLQMFEVAQVIRPGLDQVAAVKPQHVDGGLTAFGFAGDLAIAEEQEHPIKVIFSGIEQQVLFLAQGFTDCTDSGPWPLHREARPFECVAFSATGQVVAPLERQPPIVVIGHAATEVSAAVARPEQLDFRAADQLLAIRALVDLALAPEQTNIRVQACGDALEAKARLSPFRRRLLVERLGITA
ncbi:hypothetical protein D3C79_704190 [compost metagenome]